MEKKSLEIHFGLMSDSISKQLRNQKLKYNSRQASDYELCRKAIIELELNGLLTEFEHAKIKGKLFKAIKAHVIKLNFK
jgi:hypothetical protein